MKRRLILGLLTVGSASAFSTCALSKSSTTSPLYGRPSKSEDPIIQLPQWEALLAEASDPEEESSLKSKIDQAKMSAEFGVRKAQNQFYEAFSNQDYDMMCSLWAEQQDTQCNHPGMPRMTGRDEIMNSWKDLFNGPQMDVEPANTVIDIIGGTAICKCLEEIDSSSKLESLNIYKREDGEWKMTFHMASPVLLGQLDDVE